LHTPCNVPASARSGIGTLAVSPSEVILMMLLSRCIVVAAAVCCVAAVLPVDIARQAAAEEVAPVAEGQWDLAVTLPRPARKGNPQSPSVAHLWLPKTHEKIRGLILAGKILLERRICCEGAIRQAAAEKRLGILYFEPHFNAIFNYAETDSENDLQKVLAELAQKTNRPELAVVPWLTMGHSTGGIFCRNVAYWQPERVIGVVHIKSGNFQDGIQDPGRTLAGVPLMSINGEFEEYGPAGGDLGRGLRSEYSLDPNDKKQRNQSQWVLIRMQQIERRRKNPDNLMSLVVHRDAGHTSWDDDMTALTAQFIRSAADARLPAEEPSGNSIVRCRPLKAEDGWLSDADIKAPQHEPAPFAEYTGDKTLAFWHVDRAMAEAVVQYHARGWKDPDPTAGLPVKQRYTPPEMLRDPIDGKTED